MRRFLLAAFAALAAQSAAAIAPDDFAWTFPIQTDGADAAAWRVELTADAYAWIQDEDLRDVAVFNAAGQPVPVARIDTPATVVTREQRTPLPTLALPAGGSGGVTTDLSLRIERDANGRLQRIDAGEQGTAAAPMPTRDWLVDAAAMDEAASGFVLDWSAPRAGVSARFAVAASDDLQTWRPLARVAVLALQQDGVGIERRDVAIPPTRARYFRLSRLDDGAELEKLSVTARSTHRDRNEPAREWFTAEVSAPAPGGSDARGIDYALPAALPVDRVRVELGGDNAVAALTLAIPPSSHPAARDRVLARFDAFRLHAGDDVLRNDAIALPSAVRTRRLRLLPRVPMATPPALHVGYRPDALVFLAEGAGPYVLAVGSRAARRADYPLDAALATLRSRLGQDWQPPTATLGAAQAAGGEAVLREPPPPPPWRQWLLWGVLVLGAALVGGLALGLLRERKP